MMRTENESLSHNQHLDLLFGNIKVPMEEALSQKRIRGIVSGLRDYGQKRVQPVFGVVAVRHFVTHFRELW